MSECAPVCRKLEGRTALITGGDSGIGRAVAYAFAKEGANVAIAYYGEETDATETEARVTELGAQCLLLRGDLKDPGAAKRCVAQTIQRFGGLGHPGQQPRRAVHQAEHSRHHVGPALLCLSDQRIFLFLPDPDRPPPHGTGREHHQHNLGHGLRGEQRPDRL